MKLFSNRTILFLIGLSLVMFFVIKPQEKYSYKQNDYRYGQIDTNPERRTSEFFDTCSPENMQDCSRNNPYEGLPMP